MGLFSRRKEPSVGADGADGADGPDGPDGPDGNFTSGDAAVADATGEETSSDGTRADGQQRTTHKRRASTSGPCWFRPTPPTRRSNCRCKPIRTPASSLS